MDDISRGTDSATVIRRPDNYDPAQEAERQRELREHAERMIEKDKLDPRQQWYLHNVDTNKLIRTHQDYHRALENHQEVKQVTYNQALDLYRKEESAKKRALANVQKRKVAKAARKKNR